MILNFKEMYKSANEQIHAPTDVLNRVLSEAPKKPRRAFAAVKICVAAAAAITVTVTSAYLYGIDTSDEPMKIMQADTSTDAGTKKDINTEKGSETISTPETNEENAKNTERIYSAPAISPDKETEKPSVSVSEKTEVKTPEPPKADENAVQPSEASDYAVSETLPESAEQADVYSFDAAEKCADVAGENKYSAYAANSAHSEDYMAGGGSGTRKSTSFSAVSYEEYCEKIGYDVISKAMLPDGVSLVKPAEVYIDGAQNSNTFYTSFENSKGCYITLSVNKSSGKYCTVSETESGYDISIKTENLSISAAAYGFTEEEANNLAKSLSE